MTIWQIIIIILFLSFIWALRSMNDFEAPKELKKLINFKRIKGSIVFFKNKVRHYRLPLLFLLVLIRVIR